MKLKLKQLELGAGRPIAFLNPISAERMNIHIGDRVEITCNKLKIIAIVDILRDILQENQIALSNEAINYLNVRPNSFVEVTLALEPKSTQYILKKLSGKKLSQKEICAIITDIENNALTEAEIAYFVSAVYKHQMSFKEIVALTNAIWKTGKTLAWKNKIIADKHSIGGIAGNRTTPIIVSIAAAAGLTIPKTSSRAITSAAGTADVMETITNVSLSSEELAKVVKKTNASLAWGGSLGMAPADDKLIRVERLLNLDPEAQLIASIIAKKLAVGSTHVIIDIPYGPKAKVSKTQAIRLKKIFSKIAKHFKIKTKILLTDGSQPIGNGIGPVLEMRDVLAVLQRKAPPKDLEEKSIMLAGELLELTNKAKKGEGKILAASLLNTKKAYISFKKIIKAQGIKKNPLTPAKYAFTIKATKFGKIKSIDNYAINLLGRILGCPVDKSAGLYIYKHKPETIRKGEPLLTLYALSPKKLKDALSFLKQNHPIEIE